jgi:hypothetical protein
VTIDESRLLGSAVAMSAGLYCKFDHDHIVRQLNALRRRQELLHRASRRILGNAAAIEFNGLGEVRRVLDALDLRRVVLAGSLLGLTTATILAVRSLGLKIATVFAGIGEAHRACLEAAGIRLVDVRVQGTYALMALLRNLQADGHLLALRCDVPGHSRKRYRFLGYDVTCSNLIEAYARMNACTVVPIEASLNSECETTLTCREPLHEPAATMQTLLSQLESAIYRDPVNYVWSNSSIIFSDRQAVRNGFSCLPDIVAWREHGRAIEALMPAADSVTPP